ncbi:MAG: 2-oxoglutarate dehydrogenase E1 component, partial [Alphaproteobacteria bacterium]|nr:2-oxoglutarate dehydrogenase E1 component [Alphaproteobacteria bacterium]
NGGGVAAVKPASGEQLAAVRASLRALMMIRAYRVRGHLIANLDPLGLENKRHHPELHPATYGFSEADLDRPIFLDGVLGLETPTLREIVAVLRQTYCGTIGYEFMHVQYPEQKAWIQERIEGVEFGPRFTRSGRRNILRRLTRAEGFERFLHRRYTGTKRFGLEGAETLIPLLEAIIRRAAELGVEEVTLGMPHRGRLNVLANTMGKPYSAIFAEFEGGAAHADDVQGSGDVKYHLGTSSDREHEGRKIHLSLAANPSHLEAVDPVVLGKARAKQAQRGDGARTAVMALLMHGDAAFAGQGLVAECFGLSELRGYRTGGTIHIIVNNQIGFTTSPGNARSSPYPSDVAKAIQAPILHVNGDDPEAVVHAGRIATEFRQQFHKDVVLDMFCYRRHGHNESDEPAFTQPVMYRAIGAHPTTREIYAQHLERLAVIKPGEADEIVAAYQQRLDAEYEAAKGYKPNKADWLEGRWAGLQAAHGERRSGKTAVKLPLLHKVAAALTQAPEGLELHRTIRRLIETKRATLAGGEGIDWATAEALAFGTLLTEGIPVRLSGQDCSRGTFSQRHSVWIDQRNEERYVPLNHIEEGQATYEVFDSLLSEAAVLGFEYGYSLAEPNALVLWEAQFGDFANGAQVIIDQFLAAGEMKWLRMSGLVLLLPHGHEGQGPEHSSARLERYMQLSAEDNWQVVNCTTPANYFHVLRRQLHRDFRKPLIVVTPKSLLRHKRATSKLADFGPGSSFHRVLWDDAELLADDQIRRVVLCSGKIYFDLFEHRMERSAKDIAILRLEQLYPFPVRALTRELRRFPHAEIVWCQEEPRNQGSWPFVGSRIEDLLIAMGSDSSRPRYIGRPDMAASAPGSLRVHSAQQTRIVEEALTIRGARSGGRAVQ